MTERQKYNHQQKLNDKRRNPEKYILTDSLALRRRIINEHKCEWFTFMVKVPNARYAKKVTMSKRLFAEMAELMLIPSIVAAGTQKRNEAGKPCYRFNVEALRKMHGEKVDLGGKTWSAWCKAVKPEALRNNAGCAAETLICVQSGWTQIGEIDRQGHTRHCDAQTDNGDHEIKLETGYITSQFWTALHEWEQA